MGEYTDRTKGKIKEVVGAATGDRSTEAEGKMDQAKGRIKGKFEEVKQRVKDVFRHDDKK